MIDTDITRFAIDIPQADLDDLARRLDAARWPDPLPGADWEYGTEAGYLRELAAYWRDSFDWRAQERRLNELAQFTTTIDGQRIHFAHMRSADPDATPLLLTHGWPSTFADFAELVGPLTDPAGHGAPAAPAFHVVIPSLPGFGFSGPTQERGWGITRIANAWAELMRRLGYDRFLVQGGDSGSLVAPEVARVEPDQVIGVHVNALISAATVDWQSEDPTAGLTEAEIGQLYAGAAAWEQRSGYATLQATRPHTLAYALNDSPLGLLAWHVEPFVAWDATAAEQAPVDRDAILTDLTILWLTGTAGSAARLYKEGGDAFHGGEKTAHPTAVSVFPGDGTLRSLAERSHTVVQWREHDRGGHFAALQAPDLLLDDLRTFAAGLR